MRSSENSFETPKGCLSCLIRLTNHFFRNLKFFLSENVALSLKSHSTEKCKREKNSPIAKNAFHYSTYSFFTLESNMRSYLRHCATFFGNYFTKWEVPLFFLKRCCLKMSFQAHRVHFGYSRHCDNFLKNSS